MTRVMGFASLLLLCGLWFTSLSAQSGPVVAYGFNIQTTPYADASGNGRDGTCPVNRCPTYVPSGGRWGDGALDFTGTGNYLVLPGESTFDFVTTFTASLWMKRNGFINPWETLIAKGDSAWSITRYNTSRTATFTTFSSIGADDLHGSRIIDDGQWHHVAVVYDGVTKKLYVDGQLDAQKSYTQSVRNNALSVRIGFNEEFATGDYHGLIDDVRIYARVLTQTEIQSDLSVPVNAGSPPPPDTQPPSGSVVINSGAAATNNQTVALTLTATDNIGVTSMRFSNTGSSYSQAEPYGTTKVWTLSSGSGTKTVYSQFQDAAGNWSPVASDTITMDTTAPSVTGVTVSQVSTTSATVTWVTNEVSTARVEYGTTSNYGLSTPTDGTLLTNHSVAVGGLMPATSYHYRVHSVDPAGNDGVSTDRVFTTQGGSDANPPTVPSGVSATGVSASSVQVTWQASTDNVGVAGYRVYRDGLLVTTTTALMFVDGGLAPLTTYNYAVAAFDAAGNTSSLSNSVSATTTAAPAYAFPAGMSTNGRFVVDQSGRPYFINGEAAWSLIAQLSRADAQLYLADRAQKGFNVVMVSLIEHRFASRAPADFYSDQPFSSPGNFNTPNDAYFTHADFVISAAAAQGITVLLDPLYLGYGCGIEGWCSEVKASSLATMRAWGRYVGNRYKNAPNIVWLIGGDADPAATGVAARVREFVAGIKEYDSIHLVTAHNAPEQSARDPWPSESWLNLNNIYTYGDAYPEALDQFAKTPFKPVFLVETYYEHEHSSTPLSLRRQAYGTVLSGGYLGHVFGNCEIWGFSAGFCTGSWKPQLQSTGSVTLALVGRLFRTRPFHLFVPDSTHQVLLDGYQSGSTYASASRTQDGSTVVAYLPTRRTVTLDLTKITGSTARAWWYDPQTGNASLIGDFPTTGNRQFVPPNTNDWVLVIDDASLNRPAPGQN